jgi:hypothetical protein
LLGYLPLFLLQVYCTRVSMSNWLANPRDWPAFGCAVSWVLYWIASVFNPTSFSVLPAVLMFTGCHVRRSRIIEVSAFRSAVGRGRRLHLQAGVQRM